MSPVCPKIFDTNRSSKMITCHVLGMFMTFGESGSTAECTFNKTEEKFEEYDIPWDNCISLKVNNINAIIDKTNPVASRFKEKISNAPMVDVSVILHILLLVMLMMPLFNTHSSFF